MFWDAQRLGQRAFAVFVGDHAYLAAARAVPSG